MVSIFQYRSRLSKSSCRWCGGTDLSKCAILSYDHPNGYAIAEIPDTRQWLYVECPKCEYQWSLQKLGIEEI